MIKTAIVFDHRGRVKDKSQRGPLEVRLTYQRKAYYIPTGINVEMGLWHSGRISERYEWPEIEERLNIIKKKIEAEVNKCIDAGLPIVPTDIKKKVWGPIQDNSSVVDWIRDQIPTLKMGDATKKRYVTLCNRLEQYGKFRKWSDIDVTSLYDFDSWLHQLTKRQKDNESKSGKDAAKIGNGAVYNYHKCLKKMLNHAVLYGIIDINPYTRMKGQFSRGESETVRYLTEDELSIIEAATPTEGSTMAVVRDLFVFQAYTGLAYSDMQSFNINDYRMTDGRWVAVQQRVKTGVPYVSQLLPPAVNVLQRYGWQIPKMNNTKYNEMLKVMGEMLGLTKRLTSHMARHTFATMMLRHGAKIENVSRMLGHTNITQTQRYAKVLAQSVHDDFDMMERLINNKGGCRQPKAIGEKK